METHIKNSKPDWNAEKRLRLNAIGFQYVAADTSEANLTSTMSFANEDTLWSEDILYGKDLNRLLA